MNSEVKTNNNTPPPDPTNLWNKYQQNRTFVREPNSYIIYNDLTFSYFYCFVNPVFQLNYTT